MLLNIIMIVTLNMLQNNLQEAKNYVNRLKNIDNNDDYKIVWSD